MRNNQYYDDENLRHRITAEFSRQVIAVLLFHLLAMSGLEPYWAFLNSRFPNIVDGPIGILLVHEIAYFGSYLPFLIADYIPALQKYKIQRVRPCFQANHLLFEIDLSTGREKRRFKIVEMLLIFIVFTFWDRISPNVRRSSYSAFARH